MTASWITCAVLMPVIAAVALSAGWSIRRSRCFEHELRAWQAGWDQGWEGARKLYEKEDE